MATNKRALTCRVSRETFEAVKALTEGESPAFESTTEYLQSLIVSDLARRELGVDYITQKFLELLDNPEIQKLVKERLR